MVEKKEVLESECKFRSRDAGIASHAALNFDKRHELLLPLQQHSSPWIEAKTGLPAIAGAERTRETAAHAMVCRKSLLCERYTQLTSMQTANALAHQLQETAAPTAAASAHHRAAQPEAPPIALPPTGTATAAAVTRAETASVHPSHPPPVEQATAHL